MIEQNQNIEFDLETEILNTDFSAGSIDLENDNEPNQPMPTSPDDQDEFDRLLDEFINNQLEEAADNQLDILENTKAQKPLREQIEEEEEAVSHLYQEERQLYDAYKNFTSAIKTMALQSGKDEPEFSFSPTELYSRFRPSRGRLMNNDILKGWEIMLDCQATRLSSLPAHPSDEQILEFAEKTTDETLQMALISYVEILIEMEGCEINYNQRKAKAEKRKIERQIYEEHQHRLERMKKYINAIEAKKFPIDAERLVNNFFKTAKKDPDGAQKILENNPATYAPIEVDKIPPRFFGMIKPKPEDGIKVNREIGKFLKNLKA